jgi:chromatin-remodeling ATPase INO80
MQLLAQRYADTVDRIPLPAPPPPPQALPSDNRSYENGDAHSASPLSENGVDLHHASAAVRGRNGIETAHDHEVTTSKKGKSRGKDKRPASRPVSDVDSSDEDVSVTLNGRPHKKRKLGAGGGEAVDSVPDDQQSVASAGPTIQRVKKGKQAQRDASVDSSLNTTPKGRKKTGAGSKRKFVDTLGPSAQDHLGMGGSNAPSVAGDATPSVSRGASPALTVGSGTVFDFDEIIPPLKKAKKVDDATMLKRIKNLEDMQQKVWKNIARREISKVC